MNTQSVLPYLFLGHFALQPIMRVISTLSCRWQQISNKLNKIFGNRIAALFLCSVLLNCAQFFSSFCCGLMAYTFLPNVHVVKFYPYWEVVKGMRT